ncbi:MAG: ankyrin repeat domain-containing protein [Acidobacteria bacterium]|nr:ankyrin repeat domain-containing protein [Acidobacteriota bacterium]
MTHQRNLLLSLLLLLSTASVVFAQDLKEEFFAAARKGDAAAVRALLDKGVDVNTKFRYDATALSYASDRGHLEVVKLLLERKADVNVKDTFYGATPLIWAAQKGHAEIVRALLERGAEGKEDALMMGASAGQLALVKVVLDKGGLNAETLSNAYAAAERGKHAAIIELLKGAGAVPPPKADFQVDEATLKSYTGAYKPETGGDVTLSVKEGKLIVNAGGQSFTLGAFDKTHFRPLEFDGVTITFNVENGKVASFDFKQGSTTRVFKKAPTP